MVGICLNNKSYLKVLYVVLFLLLVLPVSLAAIKSNSGNISFDANSDGSYDAVLSSSGLGLFTVSPQSNLHVEGNAVVSEKINIGANSGSSNLNISGSYGYSIERVTGNTLLSSHSYVLVDTASAGSNVMLSLPNPSSVPGRVYYIKKLNSSYDVTISSNTLIDKFRSITMNSSTTKEAISLLANQDKWHIVSSFGTSSNTLTGLGNLVFWIDASSSAVSLVGGNVSQINDLSGLNNHATQGTGTAQPTFVANALKDKPVLRFDADDFLTTTSALSGNIFSVFGVMKSETWAGGNTESAWLSNRIGSSWGFELDIYNNGLPIFYVINNNANVFAFHGSWPSSFSNYTIHTYLFTENGGKAYINGENEADSPGGSSSLSQVMEPSSIALSIGLKTAGGSEPFSGDIAEIIIYDRVLSTSERLLIENYLRSKWTY